MLGCLGKVPPDKSQGHVTDYIIQHLVDEILAENSSDEELPLSSNPSFSKWPTDISQCVRPGK
jgi:hypothetical protein